MSRVAFIGLGAMGAPMARRLIAGGFDVAVFDLDAAAVARFADVACRCATSPGDAARGADFLITMLPDGGAVEAALFGPPATPGVSPGFPDAGDTPATPGGAADGLAAGALVIDMSTVGAADNAAIAARLEERGLAMVDAPVGRSPRHAAEGTLLVMAGGRAVDVEAARPLFECLAETVVHAGPPGHGVRLKLVNNYMSMVGVAMTAETLALAKAAGLERAMVVRVLQGTAAGRGAINDRFPRKVLAGDVTPEFPVRLGAKDLALALALGDEASSPVGLGGAALDHFARARAQGRDDEDCTALLLALEAGGA